MARTKIDAQDPPPDNPIGGPGDADEGVISLKLTWPEELFSPVQYNTFKVGGFEVVLKPRPGETVHDMIMRGESMLERLGQRQFERKLSGFSARLAATRPKKG